MYPNNSLRLRPFVVVAVVLALVLPFASGCGSRKAKVSGSVTLDGKGLPKGSIVFHPSKGPTVSAEITDGQYTVTGVPPGEVKVTVDTSYLKQEAEALGMGRQNMSMSMGRMRPGAGGNLPPEAKAALDREKQTAEESAQKAKELQAQYRHIPDKYTKEDSSGLSLQAKSGSNSFDVSLSSR
jgi:hypothetical protein